MNELYNQIAKVRNRYFRLIVDCHKTRDVDILHLLQKEMVICRRKLKELRAKLRKEEIID